MLARRSTRLLAFTRRDAVRLVVAASLLVAAIAAILAVEIFPTGFRGAVGDVADRDIRAPRAVQYESQTETAQRQAEARLQVPPQYDYTTQAGQASAQRQAVALEGMLAPVAAAFTAVLDDDARRLALASATRRASSSSTAVNAASTGANDPSRAAAWRCADAWPASVL